jgi:cellulose synthase/poly-beta-1,6-N-acetylglucosamine synthase-like glycosyltransferase
VTDPPIADAALSWSTHGLRDAQPQLSAFQTLSRAQRRALAIAGVLTVVCLVVATRPAGIALVALATGWYLANAADRCWLLAIGLRYDELVRIDDATALALPDETLPVYTILLPAYGEADIMRELLDGVGHLNYPREKLDVKLLLEADDELTVNAAIEGGADRLAEIVLVPPSEPRTKPKACNYGLVRARGEFVTIYDAEDVPEPLQLRRAVAAFQRQSDDVACLQCRLGYFNERQNLLTRWFSIEYDQWFRFTLPALSHLRAPIPLGGTSNHLRRSVLLDAGAWDPYNVTEDADLGIRLARLGYRTALLDSATLEEANSDPLNWMRQRSRWYKGYLQTLLVHSREPRGVARELGVGPLVRLTSTLLGPAITNLLNLVFVTAALLWVAGRPPFLRELLPTPLYFAALISLVIGNATTIYLGLITARESRKPHLLFAVLTSPGYWVLMSAAAGKAVLQLITQPSYWEKTAHGLNARAPVDQVSSQ